MSYKQLLEEIIEDIESSIHEDLDRADFIKEFRNKIELYIKEKIA